MNYLNYIRAQSICGMGQQLPNSTPSYSKKVNNKCNTDANGILSLVMIYKMEHNIPPKVSVEEVAKLESILHISFKNIKNNSYFMVDGAGNIIPSQLYNLDTYKMLASKVPFSLVLEINRLMYY